MSQTSFLISIICCTHNRQSFVEQHFAKLRDQLSPEVELLYALDNCTDGTREFLMAQTAGMSNVRVLDYRGPGGLFNCRNFGLEMATGQFLHYLDDDDSVEPGFYQRASELLANGRMNDIDVYLTGMSVERPGTALERQVIAAPALAERGVRQGDELHLRGDLFDAIFTGQLYFNCANALFARRYFADQRFRGEIRKSADWLFYLETALQRSLSFVINETLQAYYFVHASSMSVSPDKSYWNSRIFDVLLDVTPSSSVHHAKVRETCARAHFAAGYDKRRSDQRGAVRHYMQAGRLGLVGLALKGLLKLPFQRGAKA